MRNVLFKEIYLKMWPIALLPAILFQKTFLKHIVA